MAAVVTLAALAFAAEKVEYKDDPADKHIEIVMRDPEIHGLLDGGTLIAS